MLKETKGVGVIVTVLNEETRSAEGGDLGVAFAIITVRACGAWRIRLRILSVEGCQRG